GREVDGAAHVAEAPGELLLLHPFLDLGAGPGLLQPALEVGARGLALDENAAEALLARLQLPLLALVLLQRESAAGHQPDHGPAHRQPQCPSRPQPTRAAPRDSSSP